MPALSAAQLDQWRHVGVCGHQAQAWVEQVPLPRHGFLIEKRRVLGFGERQSAVRVAAQHPLGGDMPQQIDRIGDALQQCGVTWFALQRCQIGLRADFKKRMVKLSLPCRHKRPTRWCAKRPVLDHGVAGIVRVAAQVKTDEFRVLCALPGL